MAETESYFIADGAVVVGDVSLGKDSSIWYNAVVRGDMAPITIGEKTNIQDLSVVHVANDTPCIIGDRVSVGHRAILHGCTVCDDCLIGMGAIIMNGAVIGEGSIIGAGALVKENAVIPPKSLAVGVPARIVRVVDSKTAENVATAWRHYIEEAASHRSGKLPRIRNNM